MSSYQKKSNGAVSVWSDIKSGDWLELHCPLWARPYARLMRLDRPIGTWLLLLPCWWGVALACPHLPNIWRMFLFVAGAVIMRGAGCVINDIYDRNLDKEVERTRLRPLASGEIELWQAVLLLIVLLALGLAVLLLLNRFTVTLGVISLVLIFTYPLMKRLTWWPQLFLGFTFNWGALMGWSSVTESLSLASLFLYVAGIFWTLGYDTIYAHQDKRDDEAIGIKSTARLFGERSHFWVIAFYGISLLMFIMTGWISGLHQGFYALLLVAACFIAVQLLLWRMDNPENCLQRFRSNRDFGLIILVGVIVGKFI